MMTQTNRADGVQYIDINTDFGYDALGGVGRLGGHSLEVLEPGTRQTDRIPGPPKTIGRWFAKLFDRITPSSWRAQGKFRRGLEDFSAATGRLLGHLHNAGQRDLPEAERRSELTRALGELAGLRRAAEPMTRRGTDYVELLQIRVQHNLAILQNENPQLLQEVLHMKDSGQLDEILDSLDPVTQSGMAEDLALIRDALHVDGEPDTGENAPVGPAAAEWVEEQPPTEQPYHSRFSAAGLRTFFWETFTFKGHAERALRERQATLDRFAGEARDLLGTALEVVDATVHGGLPDDPGRLAEVQKHVDERMGRAIRCATDEVCELALKYLDRRESVGVAGRDFIRIEAPLVSRELDEIERSIRSGEPVRPEATGPSGQEAVSEDPFRKGIQNARRQIQEISLLYGELTEGLSELERRRSRAQYCLMLRQLGETRPPDWIDWEEWGGFCDTVIEALWTPVPDNRAAAQALYRLENLVGSMSADRSLVQEFQEALPGLRRAIDPDGAWPPFYLERASKSRAKLVELEQARALHQTMGGAGALLQRAKLPQADSLLGQALQLSRLAMRLRTMADDNSQKPKAIAELRASLSRFMSNLTLARMQTVNPTVRSAQSKAEGLDADTALEGLELLKRSVGILVSSLGSEEGSTVMRATLNAGLYLVEKGEAAALACARLLANVAHKETDVAEQLAVCVESGLGDAEVTLKGMMGGSRWNKGKHSEAKAAINAFLEALGPVRESRKQSEVLRFLAEKLGYNIVPHDAYLGFDGRIHLLINTDRQRLEGSSRAVQGTRWITLPEPESLRAGVSTGVNRLDALLAVEENRTGFYPEFYRVLESHLSGTR